MKTHVKLGLGLIACILLCSSFLSPNRISDPGTYGEILRGRDSKTTTFMFRASSNTNVYIGNGGSVPTHVYAMCHNTQEEINTILLPGQETNIQPLYVPEGPYMDWVFTLMATPTIQNKDMYVAFVANWLPVPEY